jgi:ribose transport system substrate-binding protein
VKKHTINVLGSLLLLALLTSGCTQKSKTKEILIGASLLTMQDDFYITLAQGLQDAAASHQELQLKVQIRNSDFKLGRQLGDIDDFMQQGIDVLIVSPTGPSAICPTLEEVSRKGIPVITVDIKSTCPLVKTHVMSDDVQAGRVAGQFVADQLSGSGSVAIVTHPIYSSGINRVIGFRQVLQNYPNIHILAELNAESSREKSIAVMDDLMMAHPEVNYVMGINDVMTLGAMAAIEGAGKTGQIKAVMICGGQKEAFSRLKAGDPCLQGAALLYPYQIGTQAIEAAVKILQGQAVPPEILAPVKLITHENAEALTAEWYGQK